MKHREFQEVKEKMLLGSKSFWLVRVYKFRHTKINVLCKNPKLFQDFLNWKSFSPKTIHQSKRSWCNLWSRLVNDLFQTRHEFPPSRVFVITDYVTTQTATKANTRQLYLFVELFSPKSFWLVSLQRFDNDLFASLHFIGLLKFIFRKTLCL